MERRSRLSEVRVCASCSEVIPDGYGACPRCVEDDTPTPNRAPSVLLDQIVRQLQALRNEIRSAFAAPQRTDGKVTLPSQAEPELASLPTERPLVRLSRERGVTSIDVLPAPEWRPWQIRTRAGTPNEAVEVVGKDASRRSVTISNLGTDAVVPANVWLGPSREIQARGQNTHWVPANSSLTLDTSDAVYAIDDGATATVLHIASVYMR